jgi:hypothetical protein
MGFLADVRNDMDFPIEAEIVIWRFLAPLGMTGFYGGKK